MIFDESGECVEIPRQKNVPNNAKVKSYPVVEKDRWIWVRIEDPELADGKSDRKENSVTVTRWMIETPAPPTYVKARGCTSKESAWINGCDLTLDGGSNAMTISNQLG
ncbi:MAG: hypothetical protein QGG84_01875 [Rhodospirillales bacterium]|nr:hypothetical protein [Rhodospirillales bacterium]